MTRPVAIAWDGEPLPTNSEPVSALVYLPKTKNKEKDHEAVDLGARGKELGYTVVRTLADVFKDINAPGITSMLGPSRRLDVTPYWIYNEEVRRRMFPTMEERDWLIAPLLIAYLRSEAARLRPPLQEVMVSDIGEDIPDWEKDAFILPSADLRRFFKGWKMTYWKNTLYVSKTTTPCSINLLTFPKHMLGNIKPAQSWSIALRRGSFPVVKFGTLKQLDPSSFRSISIPTSANAVSFTRVVANLDIQDGETSSSVTVEMDEVSLRLGLQLLEAEAPSVGNLVTLPQKVAMLASRLSLTADVPGGNHGSVTVVPTSWASSSSLLPPELFARRRKVTEMLHAHVNICFVGDPATSKSVLEKAFNQVTKVKVLTNDLFYENIKFYENMNSFQDIRKKSQQVAKHLAHWVRVHLTPGKTTVLVVNTARS